MRFVCDVHISYRTTAILDRLGESAVHVNRVLAGDRTPDAGIADFADARDLIVVSRDTDFPRRFGEGRSPSRLIFLTLSNRGYLDWESHLPILLPRLAPTLRQRGSMATFHTPVLWTVTQR